MDCQPGIGVSCGKTAFFIPIDSRYNSQKTMIAAYRLRGQDAPYYAIEKSFVFRVYRYFIAVVWCTHRLNSQSE